ncbi:MAG TPA: hypothetical protein VNJ07_09275, partial [Chitinophagales bacterium]|nr:hypothetical protein [Chitinophagales bacterium]
MFNSTYLRLVISVSVIFCYGVSDAQTAYPYSGDFSNCAGGTATSPTGQWTRDVAALPAGFTFSVQSNQWEATDLDGVGIWRSRVIDISCLSNVRIDISLSEPNTLTANDTVKVSYILNSGAETLFATNGQIVDD